MTEASLIDNFLAAPNLAARPKRGVSCLWAAVRDARPPSGRDANTAIWDAGESGRQIFLGAIGYIVVIDLLGKALKRKQGAGNSGRTFVDGLHDFAPASWGLTTKDRLTLYALRNGLAHRFSGINIRPSEPELTHVFALADHPTLELIRYNNQWNGNVADISRDCETVVNLRKLGDLGEDMLQHVIKLHCQGSVTIRDSADEFRATFFFSER